MKLTNSLRVLVVNSMFDAFRINNIAIMMTLITALSFMPSQSAMPSAYPPKEWKKAKRNERDARVSV